MTTTNRILNQRREKLCLAVSHERKYFHAGSSFVKRSLRPNEWQVSPIKGTIHVPRLGNERLLNEAAMLQFIRQNTDIPVPQLYSCFEDDNSVILVMEYVEGVGMNELDEAQRAVVTEELDRHLATLHSLQSCNLGGPNGIVVPPYRAMAKTFRDDWDLRPSDRAEYVLCHNDLSRQNVIVDPSSLKINAIIDWEYGGYYPEWVERRFFERLGPSTALEGEEDDSDKLVKLLQNLARLE